MNFGNRDRESQNTAVGLKFIQSSGGETAERREGDKLELGHPETSFASNELENLKIGGAVDPVFEAKASIINSAFQHIGMGKYQWKLFILCGFGWVTFLPPLHFHFPFPFPFRSLSSLYLFFCSEILL